MIVEISQTAFSFERIEQLMNERENALIALSHREPEWVPSLFDCTFLCDDVINTRPIFTDGYDCFGVHWVRSGPETNFITNVDPDQPRKLTDITKWREQLELPDVRSFDWDSAAASVPREAREEKLIYYIMGMGIFERTHTLADFQDVLMSLMVEPEAMYDLCSAIADVQVELVHHIAKYMKPDVINYHDDWAMQTAPFMPMHTWEEILKPHTKRVYDAVRSHGIFLSHHSDGKFESFIPEIIEMGVQGWNSCQDCNDLAKIKQDYGDRLVFLGALDDQNIVGRKETTDDQLMQEAIKKTDILAPGGGWLSGPNAYVSFDADQDVRIAKMVRKYSREFYSLRK